MTPIDPLAVATVVAQSLERAGLRYAIGGSVAASLIGEPRSTLDLDIMIECDIEKTAILARELSDNFYVDQESAVAAARDRGTFNAIHLATSLKIDFFVAEDSSLAREALAYRRRVDSPGSAPLYFYALEDLVARKLLWFRMGGEVSDRQWRDVLGMLRLRATSVDWPRLRELATVAGVGDLLERAISET